MTEYLIRDVERLSLQKWGSKERLDTLVASKRQQKKERQEERKADGESRKRKVAQLLEDEKLASMKLPRAVQVRPTRAHTRTPRCSRLVNRRW